MTENEAIIQIKEHLTIAGCEDLMCDVEALEVAIKALEGIQQYRAIGTVEEIIRSNANALFEQVELEKYRAIGTIEEFKALKEKSVAKKPCHPPASLIWYCPNPHCPEDKQYLMSDKYKVCPDCGQKLDWK